MVLRAIDLFKLVILIQLFYATGITILTNVMPPESLNYVTSFSDVTGQLNLQTVSEEVQGSIESQTQIPVVDVGALVFFSGNIILDLLLNFAFAMPEMLGLLISGIMTLLNVDSTIYLTVQLFSTTILIVFYFIGLIQLITSIRTGRVI